MDSEKRSAQVERFEVMETGRRRRLMLAIALHWRADLWPVHAPANCDENVGPQAPSYAGRGAPSAALQASLIRSQTARLLRPLRSAA